MGPKVDGPPGWLPFGTLVSNSLATISEPHIATTLVIAISVLLSVIQASKASDRAGLAKTFTKEFGGTIMMVFVCFTPGLYLGHLPGYEEWLVAGAGIVLQDYLTGGPMVNPAVAVAFVVWRKLSLAEAAVVITAQMAGGALAFPLLQGLCRPYGWTLGGPGFAGLDPREAAANEVFATFGLLLAVFLLCTTWFGAYYIPRMPMLAAVIRLLCVCFPATGPAMNPMVGTSWALHANSGTYPSDPDHYIVYWVGPCAGAAAAALLWSMLQGGGVFGPAATAGTPPAGSLQEAWEAHAAAFEALDSGGSFEAVLADYADDAQLVVSVLDSSRKPPSVSKQGRDGVLKWLKLTRSKDDKEQAEEAVVDEATRSVFMKWHSSKGSHGTDTYFFNDKLKIVRQNTTISKRDE